MAHVLVMRNYIVQMQRNIGELMEEYHHFRPIIEEYKPQFRRSQDDELAQEWRDLDRDQQREIRNIKDKARKLSRIMKGYSRSFSILLCVLRHGYGPTLFALYEALSLAQFPHRAGSQ